jgi:putative membrane protein
MKIKNLTKLDKEKIRAAVEKAEKETSGEVVPVILSKSDFYPAAHFRCALMMSILITTIIYYLPREFDPIYYIWGQTAGLIIGYIFAYNSKLKHFFTTGSEMKEEVRQKAIEVFHEHNIHSTKARNGILIMITLLERKVEVIADIGINDKVEKKEWDSLVKGMISNIKNQKLVDGMCEAIDSCGKDLAKYFPMENLDTDVNELPNEVITES